MKRKLITFYVFVMSSILAMAAGSKPLENTDYIISWNFRDELPELTAISLLMFFYSSIFINCSASALTRLSS